MVAFILRRLAQGAIVVGLAATIVFLLIHLAPGDPFAGWIDESSLDPVVRSQWRDAYGLGESLPTQYLRYVVNVMRGDLGFSLSLQRPIQDVLVDALPNTLLLMSVALTLSFSGGILAALAQARNTGRFGDKAIGGVAMLLFSVPDFLLAMLVLAVFAYWIPLFPIGGAIDPILHDSMSRPARFGDRARHLVLPALTLSLLYFPIIARHQRAALRDIMPSDFVSMARAKGVSERQLLYSHGLRNALLPVIAMLGVAFPALLTGAVFVEKVFSWPGMGLVTVNAIGKRDYLLVTAVVILGSAFVVIGSIIADTLYKALDPRLRDER